MSPKPHRSAGLLGTASAERVVTNEVADCQVVAPSASASKSPGSTGRGAWTKSTLSVSVSNSHTATEQATSVRMSAIFAQLAATVEMAELDTSADLVHLVVEVSRLDTSIVAAYRRNIFIASLVGAAIFAAATLAAATPVTPPPGATVRTAHPVFTWTLPANEGSQGIFIANRPAITTDGQFFEENVVDVDVLTLDTRKWSPSSPLYAGHYWWNVWSTDLETVESFYNAPTDFTIPVALRLRGITTKRYLFLHSLDIDVRWTANVRRPLVRVRLMRGRKIVWKAAERDHGSVGAVGTTNFSWYRPRRIKQGTPLKLIASISSGGVMRTGSRVVRAP